MGLVGSFSRCKKDNKRSNSSTIAIMLPHTIRLDLNHVYIDLVIV